MSRQNDLPHFYYCVHCLQSCRSLYLTFGKADGEIKLSPCESCGKPAVDPYCEREWLLVILDLVLLRQAAYRHVLWNRGRLLALQPAPAVPPSPPRASIANTTTCTIGSSSSSSSALYDHAPRSLLTATLLRAHIGMVSTQDRVDADHTPSAAWEFLQLATISVVGYSVQIATTAVLVNYLPAWIGHPASQQEQRRNRNQLWNVAALSVLLPTAGQIVTAFALLWENSHAVLSVGSLLLLVHQWMALFTLTEVLIIQQQKTRETRYIWLAQSCTTTVLLLLSLLVRGVGMILVGKAAAAGATTPCPGLGWKNDNLLLLGRNTLCFA